MDKVNEFMAVEGEIAEFAALKNIAGVYLWKWNLSDIKIPLQNTICSKKTPNAW